MSRKKIQDFVLTGSFYVDENLEGIPSEDEGEGYLSGFTLPDGRKAHIVVGLQIEDRNGEVVERTADEVRMEELGMEFGVYHHAYLENPQDIDEEELFMH